MDDDKLYFALHSFLVFSRFPILSMLYFCRKQEVEVRWNKEKIKAEGNEEC